MALWYVLLTAAHLVDPCEGSVLSGWLILHLVQRFHRKIVQLGSRGLMSLQTEQQPVQATLLVIPPESLLSRMTPHNEILVL